MTSSTGPLNFRTIVGILSALVRGDWTKFQHTHETVAQGGTLLAGDSSLLGGHPPGDFLLVDGTNSMTGDLNLNSNNIVNGKNGVFAANVSALSMTATSGVTTDLVVSTRLGTAETGGITRDVRMEQRRSPRWWLKNPAQTTYTNQGMIAAPTVTTSTAAASGDSLVRPLLTIDTTAVAASFCEVITAAFNYVRPVWLPTWSVPVRTPLAATNVRHWIGLGTQSLNAQASPTTIAIAAFYYDTGVHGTAFWRTYTCNAAAATSTTTSVAYAANTEAMYRIETDGTVYNFYIDDVRVAQHTTTLPGSSTNMGFFATLTNLLTTAAQQKVGTFTLIHT